MKIHLGPRSYSISIGDISYLASKAAAPLVRGTVWSLLRLRRPSFLFLGRNTSFVEARRLILGKGVSIGSNSYIDASASNGVTLGDSVTIREFGWIQCRSGLGERGARLRVGEKTYIGPFAVIGVGGPIDIGNRCQIGARVSISAESHDNDGGLFTTGLVTRRGVRIGDDTWIGNNVSILDGVKIGSRCVLGAGAVVTRDVPDDSTAMGVPARATRHAT